MTGDAILSSPAIGTSPSEVIRPCGDRTRPAPPPASPEGPPIGGLRRALAYRIWGLTGASSSRFHRTELPLPELGSGLPP